MAVNRYTPSPLTSNKVHQQIEAVFWLMSTDVFLSLCPSVGWIMLSWTEEGPCVSFLAIAVEEWNSRKVCDTEWVWHRPWALGAVAEKRWFIATATRWAILVNWAVKQLAKASGVLWSAPKSFLAFVDSVAMDSMWFLCLQYRPYSLESRTVHTARNCRLLIAYTVTYFIARETNKRKLWGNVLSFLIIFSLPKGQDGCHLSLLYQSNSVCCFSHQVSDPK